MCFSVASLTVRDPLSSGCLNRVDYLQMKFAGWLLLLYIYIVCAKNKALCSDFYIESKSRETF